MSGPNPGVADTASIAPGNTPSSPVPPSSPPAWNGSPKSSRGHAVDNDGSAEPGSPFNASEAETVILNAEASPRKKTVPTAIGRAMSALGVSATDSTVKRDSADASSRTNGVAHGKSDRHERAERKPGVEPDDERKLTEDDANASGNLASRSDVNSLHTSPVPKPQKIDSGHHESDSKDFDTIPKKRKLPKDDGESIIEPPRQKHKVAQQRNDSVAATASTAVHASTTDADARRPPVAEAPRAHKRTLSSQSNLPDPHERDGPRSAGFLSRKERERDRQLTISTNKTHEENAWDSDSSAASTHPSTYGSKQRSSSRSQVSPIRTMPQTKKRVDRFGVSHFARYCEKGDLEAAKQALEGSPSDIDAPDYAKNTPLQKASLEGHVKVVQYLIDSGRCDINNANTSLDTPLIDAAENGHLEVVKLLLSAGADPHLHNMKGSKPFDVINDENEKSGDIGVVLSAAMQSDPKPRRPECTIDSTTAKSNTSQQNSPALPKEAFGPSARHGRHTKLPNSILHMESNIESLRTKAAEGDQVAVFELLVRGVKPDNACGVAAARGGHDFILNLFIDQKLDIDPDPITYDFETPMLAAIGRGHPEILSLLLLQDRFDPTRRGRDGQTYFELAEERRGPRWQEEKEILTQAYEQHRKGRADVRSKPLSSSPYPKAKAMSKAVGTNGKVLKYDPTHPASRIHSPASSVSIKADIKELDGKAESSDAERDLPAPRVAPMRRNESYAGDAVPDNLEKRRKLVQGKGASKNDHRRRRPVVDGSDSEGVEYSRAKQSPASPKSVKPAPTDQLRTAAVETTKTAVPSMPHTTKAFKRGDTVLSTSRKEHGHADGVLRDKKNNADHSGPGRTAKDGIKLKAAVALSKVKANQPANGPKNAAESTSDGRDPQWSTIDKLLGSIALSDMKPSLRATKDPQLMRKEMKLYLRQQLRMEKEKQELADELHGAGKDDSKTPKASLEKLTDLIRAKRKALLMLIKEESKILASSVDKDKAQGDPSKKLSSSSKIRDHYVVKTDEKTKELGLQRNKQHKEKADKAGILKQSLTKAVDKERSNTQPSEGSKAAKSAVQGLKSREKTSMDTKVPRDKVPMERSEVKAKVREEADGSEEPPWERSAADTSEVHRVKKEPAESEEADRLKMEEARLEKEKLLKDRSDLERLESKRLDKEKQEKEKLQKEKLEKEKLEKEKLEKERIEAERAEAERVEAERVEAERVEAERVEAERVEAERAEAERRETEKIEKERADKAMHEQKLLELQRLEQERQEALRKQRLEEERQAKERAERERVEAIERERQQRAAERRNRLAQLPAALRRALELGAKVPARPVGTELSIRTHFLPIAVVRQREIDADCPAELMNTTWMLNFQAAAILGLDELDLHQFPDWPQLPVRPEQGRYFLLNYDVAQLAWDHQRPWQGSADWDLASIKRAVDLARQAFLRMEPLFWVRLADFLDAVPARPHLLGLQMTTNPRCHVDYVDDPELGLSRVKCLESKRKGLPWWEMKDVLQHDLQPMKFVNGLPVD